MKKLSPKAARRLYIGAVVVLSVIFLCSAGVLIHYFLQGQQNRQLYDELDALVNAARPSRPAPTQPAEPLGTVPDAPPEADITQPTTPWVTITDPVTGEAMEILPEFAELYTMNTDMVGWIQIDSIGISYPVMQTPDRQDYYLRRDFNRKYSNSGCLYATETADINKPSDNITIYGHRMSDGSMFANLIKFTNKSFWEKDPYIYFDTLTQRHTYQIVFVFTTTASVGEGFKYHQFVDAKSEQEFNDFVEQCRWESFYDTGIEVTYGDKLITLSTCEYSHVNGRLVVVAKRVA